MSGTIKSIVTGYTANGQKCKRKRSSVVVRVGHGGG